jgi:hypothetical protein
MDQVCAVFPVLPGKTDAARSFMRELETQRKAEYDRSERRIGITKEVWYLAQLPGGDCLVGYMESEEFNRALGLFSQSKDEFDLWFKRRFAEATGVDFNNLPPDMKLPEVLSNYRA